MATQSRRFFEWKTISMKRMLIISIGFHLIVAIVLIALSTSWRRVFDRQTIYEVDLVTLSVPPKVLAKPRPPIKKSPTPPREPVIKVPPKPEQKKVEIKPPPQQDTALEELNQRKVEKKKPGIPPPEVPQKAMEAEPIEESETAAIPPAPSVEIDVKVPDFEFPYYLRIIKGKIGSMWSPPNVKQLEESAEVVVRFILISTGKIKEVEVETSSGNHFFDQAALRAVYKADPLPPLPKGLREPNLEIHFRFSLVGRG